MDWQQRSLQWLQRPQTIVFLAGTVAIVGLVGFQAEWFKPQTPPMCELISKCHLRHGDLQRIQVALGESGLSEFTIEGQQLLVPQHRHAEYLKAVSEHNALPMDLRDDQPDSISNPLLSRSQQQALKWQQKKRQLREMILRLPFVQQAWLEIDRAASSSPFQPARQSAVISIKPVGDQPLDIQHVNTLRRMISGAVADLQADQIEVIDLGEGFAYDRAHGPASTTTTRSVMGSSRQRQVKEKQLEDQIRSALSRFAGVDVKVNLTSCPQPINPVVAPAATSEPQPKPLLAGSNGVASIYDATPVTSAQVAESDNTSATQVSYSRAVSAAEQAVDAESVCRVAVQVEVPESALKNVAMSLMLLRPGTQSGPRDLDPVEQKFGMIRPQIEREVASVLPSQWLEVSGSSPVEVTLHRSASAQDASQQAKLSELFQKYWPSVAALFVGIALLTLVVRKSTAGQRDGMSDLEILSLAQHRNEGSDAAKNAKENINRMFRDDPDGAAAAIEGWIKKAG